MKTNTQINDAAPRLICRGVFAFILTLIVALNSASIASAVEPTLKSQPLERRFGPYYGPIPAEPYSIETKNHDIITSDVIDQQNAASDPAPYFEFGSAQNYYSQNYFGSPFGYGFGPWAGYGWRGAYGFGVPFYRAPFAPYGFGYGYGAVNGYGYPRGFGWYGAPYGYFRGGPFQGFFGPGMMPGYHTYGPYTNSVIVPHNPIFENDVPSNIVPNSPEPQIIQPNNAPIIPTTPQPAM